MPTEAEKMQAELTATKEQQAQLAASLQALQEELTRIKVAQTPNTSTEASSGGSTVTTTTTTAPDHITQQLLQFLAVGNQTPPPTAFTFQAADWPNWILRFEQFRSTSMLHMLPEDRQVQNLLYIMGEQANPIYASFKLSDTDKQNYQIVKDRFDAHFVAKKTKMYERARFNTRVQQPDESADKFITDLYTIAAKCEYGALADELIRDRIIAGMTNRALSNQLQNMESEPNVETVVNRVKHAEMVANQQHLLRQQQQLEVKAIQQSAGRSHRHNNQHSRQKFTKQPGKSAASFHPHSKTDKSEVSSQSCYWCGESPKHKRQDCKARNSICSTCQGRGHFARACRKDKQNLSAVHSDEPAQEMEDLLFSSIQLGQVTTSASAWFIDMDLNGQKVSFKVDTGAASTVIGKHTFQQLESSLPRLQSPKHKLYGADSQPIETLGLLTDVTLATSQARITTDVYVLAKDCVNLLGLPDITALDVVKRNNNVAAVVQQSTTLRPEDEFREVFSGLGCMREMHKLKVKPDAVPYAVNTPRRVALPQRKPLETELRRLVADGVIEEVKHHTDWCAPVLPVIKPSAPGAEISIRPTVDYTEFNKVVLPEKYQLPIVDECLGGLAGCNVFSKLDARKSFFQVLLHPDSRDYTTFITHIGRFRFCRLPMGLKSASEVFQRRIADVLAGIPGVVNLIDDILVGGADIEEHDERLRQVLQRLKNNGLTLNEKCAIRVRQCTIFGHIISPDGILPLDSRVRAVLEMKTPEDVVALRSFLGSVNYHMRFLPHLAQKTELLRGLLRHDSDGVWSDAHTAAFEDIKTALASPPVLAVYDPKKPTRVTSDSSLTAMGAVLEQLHDDVWRPIHYVSASYSDTVSRYSMVEKEAYAAVLACERLEMYLLGLPEFTLRVDHKPLLAILGSKPISDLPVRLQRFRMRLVPFRYRIEHISGKAMTTADFLSRCALPDKTPNVDVLEEDLRLDSIAEEQLLSSLPMSSPCRKRLQAAQLQDSSCSAVKEILQDGWPNYHDLADNVKPFNKFQEDLHVVDNTLVFKNRIYVPAILRAELMAQAHVGHLPSGKSIANASQAIWWPSMNKDITNFIARCHTCLTAKTQRAETMHPGAIPLHPWDVVGADIGVLNGKSFLVIIDGYSSYPIYKLLPTTDSSAVIRVMKDVFAMFGSPGTLKTDGGPQFASEQFRQFAKDYDFNHVLFSPTYAQSNGLAEIGIKVVKHITEKSPGDPFKALQAYRAAPNGSGYSPAQLFLGRRIKTTLPVPAELLRPVVPDIDEHLEYLRQRRDRAKADYDRRHRAKDLSPLSPGDRVYIPDMRVHGHVVQERGEPRSYDVATDNGGNLRRNRRDLILLPAGTTEREDVSPLLPDDLGQIAPQVSTPRTPSTSPQTVPSVPAPGESSTTTLVDPAPDPEPETVHAPGPEPGPGSAPSPAPGPAPAPGRATTSKAIPAPAQAPPKRGRPKGVTKAATQQ